MSKQRKRKRTSRASTQTASSGAREIPNPGHDRIGYMKAPYPFRDLSEKQISKLLTEGGLDAEEKFQSGFRELRALIGSRSPVHLLASFAMYGLSVPEGAVPELTEEEPLLQHHLELVQALALQAPLASYPETPFIGRDFVDLKCLIRQVTQAFAERRIWTASAAASQEERRRIVAVEAMRLNTQSMRNWAFSTQMRRVVSDLFAPLETRIKVALGINVAALLGMVSNLIVQVEDRLNGYRDRLRPALRAADSEEAVTAFRSAFPDVTGEDVEEILAEVHRSKVHDECSGLLFLLGDLTVPDIYTFTPEAIRAAYGGEVDEAALTSALARWSLGFGDLVKEDPEHFFLGNPVWTRPLITLPSGEVFVPLLPACLSFCMEQMESLIADDKNLWDAYLDRRGDYLEQEAGRIFRRAFPGAKVFCGSQWMDPSTDRLFENDLLVRLDSYLLVVEAKAGRVTAPARRGAPARLATTIQNLLVDPAIQSKRFAEFLQQTDAIIKLPTRRGGGNEVDACGIYKVIRLSVTLDMLAVLNAPSADLKAAGLIASDLDVPPTMSITDLDLVMDLLDSPGMRLHYLVRRTEFEEHAKYHGDEIDLLVFYLDTGFNVGEAEFNGSAFELWGMSQLLDPYFTHEGGTSSRPPKPQRKLTEWWKSILHRVEVRVGQKWSEIAHVLLNVSYDYQQVFEKQFRTAREVARRNWWKKGHTNSVELLNGPPQRRDAIVGLAYRGTKISRDQRNRWIETVASEAMDEAPADRAIVLGWDVDRKDYPYSILACLDLKDPVETPEPIA